MILVTGATGKLGRHVMEGLLRKVPAAELAVAVRNVAKAADFAARGVAVRHADYDQPDTLVAAFTGIEKVLLISGSEVGNAPRSILPSSRRPKSLVCGSWPTPACFAPTRRA